MKRTKSDAKLDRWWVRLFIAERCSDDEINAYMGTRFPEIRMIRRGMIEAESRIPGGQRLT